MKYIIFTQYHYDVFKDKVFEYIEHDIQSTTFRVLGNSFFITNEYKTGEQYIVNDSMKFKDVTFTYKKLKSLYYMASKKYILLKQIKHNFETGIYPSKENFEYMNLIYKEEGIINRK